MEQVIFLQSDEESGEALSQIQRSPAQRLVLVAPAQMDRLRLSLLLRLARRYTIAQARQLCVVSEDRLAQMLARRLGFAVASTLDEYRGLTPGPSPSSRKHSKPSRQPALPLLLPAPRPPIAAPAPPRRLLLEAPLSDPPEQQSALRPGRPSANLEKMLVDGYLPNPAAIPDLEEEEERAEREERERLHYEIADENFSSQAQQEAEQHEEQIIARILKTSLLGTPPSASPLPASINESEGNAPAVEAASDVKETEDPPPDSPAAGSGTASPSESHPARSAAHQAEQPPGSPQPPADAISRDDLLLGHRQSSLPPLRTIDELLYQRGARAIFDWFERTAAEAAAANAPSTHGEDAAQVVSEAPPRTSLETEAAPSASSSATAPAFNSLLRQPGRLTQASRRLRSEKRVQLRLPGEAVWRRIGIISALALSFLMTGLGLALIPSAAIAYREEISPYSEVLLFDAQSGASNQLADTQHIPLTGAETARFDGVLTASAPASGRRSVPGSPDHLIAFPTQDDVDQIASRLQAQLQLWGAHALQARQEEGDILGPVIAEAEVLAFPPVGTNLPDGVSSFQVSLALHLRATLIPHQALLQATQTRLRQDINQRKPGFAPRPGQTPQITILSVEPAGPGDAALELILRAQVSEMIGPALTPEQARSAIAGMTVHDAEAYLSRQPGITDVSISEQPKWLNRLPIFSARIRIYLEN